MNGDCVLEARDVVKSFGSTPALRGASVAVGRGEILAVMGPSGSGKSTLLHCLAGILVPDGGQVLFDGQRLDTMKENPRSALRRDKFGFVFQFGQLVPELTAEENVAPAGCASGPRRGPPRPGQAPSGGSIPATTTAVRRSTGSTWPRSARTRRCRPASRGCPAPASTTPPPRWPRSFAPSRPGSSRTGIPATRPERSARRRSGPPARC